MASGITDHTLTLRELLEAGEPGRPAVVNSEFARTYGTTEVKILQFYTAGGSVTQANVTQASVTQGSVIEGSRPLICYSVLNAKSVRIELPLAGVYPALNRCVEAATPVRETRYALTTEGQDGRTVSQSFVVGVRSDRDRLPGCRLTRRCFRHCTGRATGLLRGSTEDYDVHADGHRQVRAQSAAVAYRARAAGVKPVQVRRSGTCHPPTVRKPDKSQRLTV